MVWALRTPSLESIGGAEGAQGQHCNRQSKQGPSGVFLGDGQHNWGGLGEFLGMVRTWEPQLCIILIIIIIIHPS